MKRRLTAPLVLTVVLAAVGAGVGTTAKQPAASASALAISVSVPGEDVVVVGEAVAPGDGTIALADSFAYPADGSIVQSGALSSSGSAQTDGEPEAHSVTDVLDVSLFGGEITFDSAAARANASSAVADTAGSAVSNLVIGGQPVDAAPDGRFTLGDWGAITTLEGTVEQTTGAATNARSVVTAVRITLTAEHAGMPAGTEILIGHAEAASSVPEIAVAPVVPVVVPVTPPVAPVTPAITVAKPKPPAPAKIVPKPARPAAVPERAKKKKLPNPPPEPVERVPPLGRAEVQPAPTDISAPLSPRGYVFPVYGASSFVDTYGAPRADVSWHHGQDIFAALGSPLLAVAAGTVFSVGWNDIGGYRFWLRDRSGNQFYYAHLSAFSSLAVNGNEVKAGDVIAFMGNTGDAQGTPYHLHFEIHPVALLPLGYDGVVNPFAYLTAWRHLEDVSFAAERGWAPPVPATATAPRPGAFLLGSTDISTASGLEPGALQRALVAPVSAEGDGALLRSG